MAEQESYNSLNDFAMSAGDGVQIYAKNSSIQIEKLYIDAAKFPIQKSISKNFEPINFPTRIKTFCIADLGCSVGSNTSIAVDNIIEAVKLKYSLKTDELILIPEFQVYFNDCSDNDFNTLFKSLPPNREYYASGVPGSFYTRLFPSESLHFVHSSNSLPWLSQAPKEITDKKSGAWNKGRIFHIGAGEEVTNAYSRQHAMDFNKFLQARAQKLVPGGLLVVLLSARPNGLFHSKLLGNIVFDMLGACLMDLARKGVIDEEKVDAFNLPIYLPSPEEIERVIKQNGRYSIEIMEILPDQLVDPRNLPPPQNVSLMLRVFHRGANKGSVWASNQILDQVFGLFTEKFANAVDDMISSSPPHILFILLKLKQHTAPN